MFIVILQPQRRADCHGYTTIVKCRQS